MDALLDEATLPIVVAAVGGAVVLLAALFFLCRPAGGRAAAGRKKAATRSKTALLLCGPLGSGKTTIFQCLRGGAGTVPRPTYSSMEPNRGTAAQGGFAIVDFPGHPRLQGDLLREVLGAKVVVVVVDAVAAADSAHLSAVVGTVSLLLECPELKGSSRLVIAAHKRDDATSYSARALKKMLEGELTKKFGARAGEVGAVKGKGGDAGSERLVLREGEKFSFDAMAPVETRFVDTAALGTEEDNGGFSLAPLVEAM